MSTRQRYTVVIQKDPESEWYVAEVPALPGCVSQGRTTDEALANIRDAIVGWLETAAELNRVRPIEALHVTEVEVEVPVR